MFWVMAEINHDPLLLCSLRGSPYLGMISQSSALTTSAALSVQVGNASTHPEKVSIYACKQVW